MIHRLCLKDARDEDLLSVTDRKGADQMAAAAFLLWLAVALFVLWVIGWFIGGVSETSGRRWYYW
jgi:hypothetical protein